MKFTLFLQRQIRGRSSFMTALDNCLRRSSYSLGLIFRYSDMDKLQHKSLFTIPNDNADRKNWLDRSVLSASRTWYEPEHTINIIRSRTFRVISLDGRVIEECRARYDDPQTINLSTVPHYYGICHPDYLMNKTHLDQTISRAQNSSYAAKSANRWIIPSSVQTPRMSTDTLLLGQAVSGKSVLQNRLISKQNKIRIHSCRYDLHPQRASRQILNRASICCA